MELEYYAFGPYKIHHKGVFYYTDLSYAMVNLRPLLPGKSYTLIYIYIYIYEYMYVYLCVHLYNGMNTTHANWGFFCLVVNILGF